MVEIIVMAELLALDKLCAGYGEAIVISDICLRLEEGRSLAVLGRNGVGKTTLVNSIIGVTRHRGGRVILRPRHHPAFPRRAGAPRHRLDAAGAQHLPLAHRRGESHARRAAGAMDARARLRDVPAACTSGAATSAISSRAASSRCLRSAARSCSTPLILLDEPTEGLAPIIVEELLAGVAPDHPRGGLSCIVVEQHAKKILGVTDEAIILERGMIVHAAESSRLAADTATLERYLGATGKS